VNPKPWPCNNTRKTPADWRFGVTTCIASIAQSGNSMVLVSDSKLAFGDFSADDAVVKNIPFVYPWIVLISGDDISYATPIIERASRRCLSVPQDQEGWEIAEILHEEIVLERQKLIEAAVLKKYGFSADSFLKKGKRLCSEALYSDLIIKVSQIEISLAFLLCGFSPNGFAQIWCIYANSSPQNYDIPGFWAIGSGANAALSSLSFSVEHHHYGRHSELENSIYHLLAAKFMSESARDVGKGTFTVILQANGDMHHLYNKHVKAMRDVWLKEGAPQVSHGAIKFIGEKLVHLPREERIKQSSAEKSEDPQ